MLFILFFLLAASGTFAQRPTLWFDCRTIPSVCSNMCYGANCHGLDNPLHYDKAAPSVVRYRRRVARCNPHPNRCRGFGGGGHTCDEWPFASTVKTAQRGRINRCVPARQNNHQGGRISAFYRHRCNGRPCTFNVGVRHVNEALHCHGDFQCNNHINERGPFTSPAKRDIDVFIRQSSNITTNGTDAPTVWKLASGAEVTVFAGADVIVGSKAYSVVPMNETLFEQQVDSEIPDEDDDETDGDEYDFMIDNLEVVEDTFVEQVS